MMAQLGKTEITRRFINSVDGTPPSDSKKAAVRGFTHYVYETAKNLDDAEQYVELDQRLKAMALTKLEEALMLGNKAIFSGTDITPVEVPDAD